LFARRRMSTLSGAVAVNVAKTIVSEAEYANGIVANFLAIASQGKGRRKRR
jgi:hypothetical protein